MPKKPNLKSAVSTSMSKTTETFQTTKATEGATLLVNRKKKGILRRATIYLRPEQWRLLRIRAAEKETDVSGLLRELVDKTLSDE